MQPIWFGKYQLESPIMNGAGTCKTVEDVRKLATAPVAAIMIGSYTVNAQDGNPGDVWASPLNSLGMPNRGIEYLRKEGREMRKIAHDAGKYLAVSVAGYTPDEYCQLSEVAFEIGADWTELNKGCPNVWVTGGRQKEIVSFDEEVQDVIFDVMERAVGGQMYGPKYSPYTNPAQRIRVAQKVRSRRSVSFVTGINTFPNCYLPKEDGNPSIGFGKGLGGYSGPGMKAPALGQLVQFKEVFDEDPDCKIQYVYAGGVCTGRDVLDATRCGATLVQVVTAYAENHDPRVFERIATEYVNLVDPVHA